MFVRQTFTQVENDGEYKTEDEASDEVDSDFDIDENDEPASDMEKDEEEGQRKKRRVMTKAYKEPVPIKKEQDKASKPKVPRPKPEPVVIEKKSVRQTTAEKSQLTQEKLSQEAKKPRRKISLTVGHRMTQEELLEEAKLTEQENLKSLESYQKLELEKKKSKFVKQAVRGPTIRYHSVSMPLVDEASGEVKGRCSRNFVTFSDEPTMQQSFPRQKGSLNPAPRHLCPFTRQQARYQDPVTGLPFSSLQAFRVLREAYYQQLEQRGDARQPDVAAWLEWRRSNRKSTIKSLVSQPMIAKGTLTPAT
ncbi:VPS72 [Cordylochernes scorpioides]|uniref:Vacuolar protein sorting-associated protein 72 homolog n=1 Tax=Cordylochernes scorpioides TaxID=51811 RepID=A0ABY6KPD9_9ARAC|nr:VPS72 [Cordylochernes scorpioides]